MEEGGFGGEAGGVAGEAAASAHHAVAGDDQGDGVAANGGADGPGQSPAGRPGPRRGAGTHPGGNLPVGGRAAVGDGPEDLPDGLLERSSYKAQRGSEVRLPAAEIDVQPPPGLVKDRQVSLQAFRAKDGSKVLLAPPSGEV